MHSKVRSLKNALRTLLARPHATLHISTYLPDVPTELFSAALTTFNEHSPKTLSYSLPPE